MLHTARKPLVLVVDDEKDVADLIAEEIRASEKFAAIVAYSAKEALDAIEKHKRYLDLARNRIRCIVLDIKMPEMDGLVFLATIRKEMTHPVPVILLSAWEDDEKWVQAVDHRVARYLRKPYKRDELLAHIEEAIHGILPRMQRETEALYITKKVKGELDP